MPNTQVVIRDEMGLRVPSVPSVPIVSLDTVTFTVDEGADSALYFSPETASILSPTPGSRVDLSYGQELTYTFASPGASAYGVITQAPSDSAPNSYNFGSPAEPPVLVVQPGQGSVFSGPDNSPIG
jgi:hypothetical protein